MARDWEGEREAATAAVVKSREHIRVVVAGPGTGKTTAFKRAFVEAGGQGLAMTFIKVLRDELRAKLPHGVRVSTFHGFALGVLREAGGKAELFSSLLELVSDDLRRLRGRGFGERSIEIAFHDLNDADQMITDSLARMDAYEAVTFVDVVYRVLRRFEAEPEKTPRLALIVVDEYQDFSLLETRFIAELARQSPLLVAGDDDQALYSFKRASPQHLRDLLKAEGVAAFNLPFCSRCTSVIVAAVNDVVSGAVKRGHLSGRIDKPFECFLPDKQKDSDAHPKIIHARLATHDMSKNQIGQYVVDAIAKIPVQDILESKAPGSEYPTALVLGPRPFIEHAIKALKATYPQTQDRLSEPRRLDPLDGYRYLAHDPDSKLGWRIILHSFFETTADAAFDAALKDGADLRTTIPSLYRTTHARFADLIRRLLNHEALTPAEEQDLAKQLGRTIKEIREKVAPEMPLPVEEREAEEDADEEAAEAGVNAPTIVCTSLVGAKGLSAGYVFFVGCLEDYATTSTGVTTDDICKFIVALSRTRKELHLISCGHFQGWAMKPCSLIAWIAADRIETHEVG